MKTYTSSLTGRPFLIEITNALSELGKDDTWSPVSIDILRECESLPNAKVVEYRIYDENYNYDLMFPKNEKPKNHRTFFNRQLSSVARRIRNRSVREKLLKFQLSLGYPIDQTAKVTRWPK